MGTNRLHMIVRKDEKGMLHAHNREDGSLDLYLRFCSAYDKCKELADSDTNSTYSVVPIEVGHNLFNE